MTLDESVDYNDSYNSELVGGAAANTTTNELQDDVVIAVMGSTGTGKSSFIKLISGDASVHVGDSLESETSEIQVVRFVEPKSGRKIVIVDTPGFDDSRAGVTDTDILKEITKFLLQQYDNKRKLNGLVYLQRISDPRFSGQSVRNLRMFKGLCGSENYKNVVVLTTYWDRIATKEEGVAREKQLKTRFFKELVDGGARLMRHEHGNMETARNLLGHIFTLLPTNVQIQEEIRKEGKTLEATVAGSVHSEEIERMIAKQKEEVESVQEEIKTLRANNTAEREALKEELDKLQEQLARQERERLELKKGLDDEKASQEQLKQEVAKQKNLRSNHEQAHLERMKDMQKQLDEEEVIRKESEEEMQKFEKEERARREREVQEREKRLCEEREREAAKWQKREQEMLEREKREKKKREEEKQEWEKRMRDEWERQAREWEKWMQEMKEWEKRELENLRPIREESARPGEVQYAEDNEEVQSNKLESGIVDTALVVPVSVS